MLGLIADVIALGAFFVRETVARHPVGDFSRYGNRVFALGTIAGQFSFVAIPLDESIKSDCIKSPIYHWMLLR